MPVLASRIHNCKASVPKQDMTRSHHRLAVSTIPHALLSDSRPSGGTQIAPQLLVGDAWKSAAAPVTPPAETAPLAFKMSQLPGTVPATLPPNHVSQPCFTFASGSPQRAWSPPMQPQQCCDISPRRLIPPMPPQRSSLAPSIPCSQTTSPCEAPAIPHVCIYIDIYPCLVLCPPLPGVCLVYCWHMCSTVRPRPQALPQRTILMPGSSTGSQEKKGNQIRHHAKTRRASPKSFLRTWVGRGLAVLSTKYNNNKKKRSDVTPDPGGHRPQCPCAQGRTCAKQDQAQTGAPGQMQNRSAGGAAMSGRGPSRKAEGRQRAGGRRQPAVLPR